MKKFLALDCGIPRETILVKTLVFVKLKWVFFKCKSGEITFVIKRGCECKTLDSIRVEILNVSKNEPHFYALRLLSHLHLKRHLVEKY